MTMRFPLLDANGLIDARALPSNDDYAVSMMSAAWFFAGEAQVRNSASRVVTPATGTVELYGVGIAARAVPVGGTGDLTVAIAANGTTLGSAKVPSTSLASDGWFKDSPTLAKRIFASTARLPPETILTCNITGIPSGVTTNFQDVTVTLWWKWRV